MSTAPPFRFRLERVRTVRRRTEDLARQELTRAEVAMSASHERLRTVEDDLEQARNHQRSAAGQPVADATELLARQVFIEHVEAQRAMGVRELERHETDVADRNVQLGVAAREHRMLERLEERQRAAHQREAARREDQRLDEIALERFRRSAA